MFTISPHSLTFITTYQCTAACKECCFECSPQLSGKLQLAEMIATIDQALQLYPQIKLVVFTGGECFTLKEDLFQAIQYCSSRQLLTRCVTNGYWAKRQSVADDYAKRLAAAGIKEINISTGADHQQWVTETTVIQAAVALVSHGIFTLVTVEKDSAQSNCFLSLRNHPAISKLLSESPSLFSLRSNVWMPFFQDSQQRGESHLDLAKEGCPQVFDNVVITPNKEVSACCGLTLEHIPEMKLGDITDLSCYTTEQNTDFLKLWIHTEGPYKIIQRLMGEDTEKLKGVVHNCQACAILHQDKDIIEKLTSSYHQHIMRVYHQYHLQKSIR